MNGKIKIFSKANMLDQYLKMALVLTISVLITLFLNNTFLLGELILKEINLPVLSSRLVRIAIFSVLGFASYIAILPFHYGKEIWFFENARKNKLPVKKLFSYYGFKKSRGALKVMLSLQIRKFLITLLFLLPALTLGGYILYSLKTGIGQKLLISLTVSVLLLTFTGAFFSFVISQKYFLVPYLYHENEPCRVRDLIKLSSRVMENRCFETAFLHISFIPWILLYIFIFPAAYVYPYYKLTISFKAVTILNNT